MSRSTTIIDRDALRAAIRHLERSDHLVFLDRAIDLLSEADVAKMVKDYVDLRRLQRDPAARRPSLLEDVRAFHAATLAREHWEDFRVDSRNFMRKSAGTAGWIADCERHFGRCLEAERNGSDAIRIEVRDSLRLLFDLLRRIDRGDEIVFFADEGGSWQVGVLWDRVLPCHFRCLAASVGAAEYATEVRALVRDFASHDAGKVLGQACRAATPEQRLALPEAEGGQD